MSLQILRIPVGARTAPKSRRELERETDKRGRCVRLWMAITAIAATLLTFFALSGCTSRAITLPDGTRYQSTAILTSRSVHDLEIQLPDGSVMILRGAKSDVVAAIELADRIANKLP